MNLSRSLRAFGADDFAAVLKGELASYVHSLPTESVCEQGGWPVDVEIVGVSDVSESADEITALVTATFTESFGTGCANVRATFPRSLTARVVIARSTGAARIEPLVSQQEYEPEF